MKTPKDALAEVRSALNTIYNINHAQSAHVAKEALQILDSIEVVGEESLFAAIYACGGLTMRQVEYVEEAIKDAGFLVLRGKKS